MSWHTISKANKILRDGEVKLKATTDSAMYFEVKGYRVIRRLRKWSCTCVSGSLWNVGSECSHVVACRKFLKGEDL